MPQLLFSWEAIVGINLATRIFRRHKQGRAGLLTDSPSFSEDLTT